MGKFFRISIYKEAAFADFATDEAEGTVPTRSFGFIDTADNTLENNSPGPYQTRFIRVTNVHHRLNPANAVTYDLYLYATVDGAANSMQLMMDKFYDSNEHTPNCADDTEYLYECDRVAHLCNPALIYYVIDWSAAPGDTTGFIEVCGERDEL